MTWFWMNIPLAAAFFAAWTAIPLWLVLKHPETSTSSLAQARPLQDHAGQAARPGATFSGAYREYADGTPGPLPRTADPSATASVPGSPGSHVIPGATSNGRARAAVPAPGPCD